MNKDKLALVGGLVAFGAALLLVSRPAPASAPTPQPTSASASAARITTDGSAVVRVQPDKVTLRLGVETFASTPRESQASNSKLIEAVIKAIRGLNVPAQDISTDYFAVLPEYTYTSGTARKIDGYRTHNTLSVSLHQVSKLSDVLTAALEAGATNVEDVSFSTSRLRELRDQARTMAVKAALQKAQGMAGAANLTMGDVQSIADNSRWYYYGWGYNTRMSASANLANMTQNVAQAASSSAETPPEDGEFSLGQIVVQAQVDLTVAAK
jgi:uncharacterized protein YggE